MHPGWVSNAYLVADEEGGSAVYVDSGAPLEPLLRGGRAVAVPSRRTSCGRTAIPTTSSTRTSSGSKS